MLKKMRLRFILAAMISFGAVILILIVGIYIVHDMQLRHSQDEMLERIYEYDRMAVAGKDESPPITEMPWAGGPDREFVFHFFVVHSDEDGNLKVFGNEHISSINEDTAQTYTRTVLERGTKKGYQGEYRYLVKEEEQDVTLIFLNVTEALDSKKALLRISLLVGCGSLLAVFLLILVLSRPAIRPFVRNMEQQRQFITDAEHELKTPITSIATSADIAAMEFGENEWIRDIQNQAKRLSSLTNELIMLSRMDEQKPFPEKTQVQLSDAAWEIVEPFETRTKASGRQFFSSIEEGITVIGDRTSLQQLMSILLDNAIRYSDQGGIIRFAIARCHGQMVRMNVYNTCDTLPKMENPDRLFDRFYRPDPARDRHTGGSGLGLSIAKMIVVRHGGKIQISMKESGSITFSVALKENV